MTEIGLITVTEPLPHRWGDFAGFARRAEEIGADALWFSDHLRWYRPTPDPIGAIALAAGATERAIIGSLVLQLPMHRIDAIAKSFGFLDAATDGRIVLGVGVGEHRWEYDAAGVGDRFGRRGRLLDDAIDELRHAWSRPGDPPIAPTRPVPIWVGGRSTAARRRAARAGDAWIPHFCHIRWFRRQAPRFFEDASTFDRGDRPRLGASLLVHVDEVEPGGNPTGWAGELYRIEPSAFAPILIRGSADEVVERLLEFADAGADHLAILPAGDHPLDHLQAVRERMPQRRGTDR